MLKTNKNLYSVYTNPYLISLFVPALWKYRDLS